MKHGGLVQGGGSRINKSFSHQENCCSECQIWISDISVIQSYILFTHLSNKSGSITGIMFEVFLISLIFTRQVKKLSIDATFMSPRTVATIYYYMM